MGALTISEKIGIRKTYREYQRMLKLALASDRAGNKKDYFHWLREAEDLANYIKYLAHEN